MTRARPFLALALALMALSGPLLAAAPAAADCMGPTIEYDAGEVRPGDTVTVRGSGWGDSCYDTGPPPDGEGVLGRPVQDIALVVEQGPVSALVALGSADEEYEFEVDVTVPSSILPGEARVRAFWARGIVFDATDAPLVVVGEPPPDLAETAPVRFGPGADGSASTLVAPDGDEPEEAANDATAVDAGEVAESEGSSPGQVSALWLLFAAAAGAAVAMVLCLRGRTSVTTADRIERSAR